MRAGLLGLGPGWELDFSKATIQADHQPLASAMVRLMGGHHAGHRRVHNQKQPQKETAERPSDM